MAELTKLQKVQYDSAIRVMRAVACEMVGDRNAPTERQLYKWYVLRGSGSC